MTTDESLPGFSHWQEIGRGGDATVYRATQDALNRDVAIKVLMVDDAESVRRFTREVQLMVSLGRQHPNIANVLQIGTSSRGRPCIVMDFYELGSLDRQLSATGPLSAEEVTDVGAVIADALAFAHSNGVLHRDVKPQNILRLPTSYVLSDFGIARLIDSGHTSSSDRFSYRHASPQVLDGLPPSEADDIFSLGATLFHLLDGKPPFTTTGPERDSALAYIGRVRSQPPRPLTRTDVPRSLVTIIDRALEKDPARRFPTAAAMRDELRAVALEARHWGPGGTQSMPAMYAAPVNPPAQPPQVSPAAPVHQFSAAPTAAQPAPTPLGWGPGPGGPGPGGPLGPGVPGGPGGPVPGSGAPGRPLPGPGAQAPGPGGPAYGPPAYPAQSSLSPAQPVSVPSAAQEPAPAAEPERPSRMPLLAIGGTGIVLGVIVVVIIAFLTRQPQTTRTQPPPVTPTPVSTPTPRLDQSLSPKGVSLSYDKGSKKVTVTWTAPETKPDQYFVLLLVNDATEGQPEASPTTTFSRTLDPVPTKVCAVVIASVGSRIGTSGTPTDNCITP
ncbi:serine/threonine-protein kinase [Granulicoccus phenolivorans]|uniref:serine/threonine-protein kinase n=1 Tax=Granulicoccus phenolivorans TaxID=266854 RepID=UPI0004265C1B|nr:serine/threonine-protein kinase [Granulicoccus phenolivorans]